MVAFSQIEKINHETQIDHSPPDLWKTGAAEEYKTAAIGMAQAGTAILQGLLNILEQNPAILPGIPLSLLVSAENSEDPGPAYRPENGQNLLNAPAGSMTYGQPKTPFHVYLKNLESSLVKLGLLEKNPHGYAKDNVRRMIYGMYLKDTQFGNKEILHRLSKRFRVEWHGNNPATDIWSEPDKTHLVLKNGQERRVDAALVAIGGFEPNKLSEAITSEPLVRKHWVKYCNTPYYPETLKQFRPDTDITILGNQLSGLEAALAINLGKTGHIRFFSRTGAIPPLVPLEKKLFKPKYFTMEKLISLKEDNQLNAESLQKLVQDEADFQCLQPEYGFSKTFSLDDYRHPFEFGKDHSPEHFTEKLAESFAQDIAAIQQGKMTPNTFGWIVMNSIYSDANKIFLQEMLPASQHKKAASILTWHAAQPLQTGEKVVERISNGQLSFVPGMRQKVRPDNLEKKLVLEAAYVDADGVEQIFEYKTDQIIDALGGHNTTMYNLNASKNKLQQSALRNGVFPPHTGIDENGETLLLGGLAYDKDSYALEGTAENIFINGSLMNGKTLPRSSGTAGGFSENGTTIANAWFAAADKAVNTPARQPKLQRDEIIELCNQQLKKLHQFLATNPNLPVQGEGENKGKIRKTGLSLVFPDQRLFSMSDVGQFAIYSGIADPAAGKEIGERDSFIVSKFIPGKKETPLFYFSVERIDKQGNKYWTNIVGWKKPELWKPEESPKPIMEPTRFQLKKRKAWIAPSQAKHSDTVNFAVHGKADGTPPAFPEIHFMLGTVDAFAMALNVEEHRVTLTSTKTESGKKEIYRLETPKHGSSSDKRWMTIARQSWKPLSVDAEAYAKERQLTLFKPQ